MSVVQSDSYKSNYDHLINCSIREYDLSKANIGVLFSLGVLDEEQYLSYANSPKKERVVEIGCYFKFNPDMVIAYREKLKQIRLQFVEVNQIQDHQILYVDRDSITVIDPLVGDVNRVTNFGTHLDFKVKNVYTSYYKLGPIDFLYSSIQSTYRVKYGGEKVVQNHTNGFIDFLVSVAKQAETNVYEALMMVKDTYEAYTKLQLDINYYREFNQQSQFKLLPGLAFTYYTQVSPNDINLVDISYNANLMRDLIRYLSKEYFK